MDIYVLNPAYCMKQDGSRVVLLSKNIVTEDIDYQECFTYLHPLNAQMLTFFNGIDKYECVKKKVSQYFGLPEEDIDIILKKYIENKRSFSIKYKEDWMFFPQNLIVNKARTQNYHIYNTEDFKYLEDPDFKSNRLEFPLSINLLLTMKCYTDCIYCYANRKMNLDNPLNLEQILSIIDQAAKGGVVNFDINGGEVLLHANYREIIHSLLSNGYYPSISTKIPISNNQIQILKEIGICSIQVSLDSSNATILKKMIQVNDSYINRMIEMFENLENAGLDVTIHTIITSMNSCINGIDALIFLLSKYKNINKIRFSPAGYSLYKASDYSWIKASEEFMGKLQKYINNSKLKYPDINFEFSSGESRKIYDKNNKKNIFSKRARCTGNLTGMVILPDGRVTICEELYEHPAFVIGDLTKHTITDVWNSKKAKDLFYLQQNRISDNSACKTCNEFKQCRQGQGVCWKILLMAYGNDNWDFPDPRCPKAPPMINNICLK